MNFYDLLDTNDVRHIINIVSDVLTRAGTAELVPYEEAYMFYLDNFIGRSYADVVRFLFSLDFRCVPNTDNGDEWYHYPDGKTYYYTYFDNGILTEIHYVE